MKTKSLRDFEIKNADRGEISAVFSTFSVIDSDDDVTLPGAFEDGAPWKISAYGHQSWMGALPAGKGTVRATSTEAILDGTFFMNTTHGRDTFEVVKQMGELQEWSYSVHPLKHSYGDFEGKQVRFLEKLDKGEVSPVLVGAGVGTRTLAVKSGLTFTGEAGAVLADLEGLVDRAADVMAKRRDKGKALGADSSALLERVEAQCKRLGELLAPEPETTIPPNVLQLEYLRRIAKDRGFIA